MSNVTLARELRAIARTLECDYAQTLGMVEEVYQTEDAETGEDITDEAWANCHFEFAQTVKYLRRIADGLPEIILAPSRKG